MNAPANEALAELIASRREFPVAALIKLWLKTNPASTHNTYRYVNTYLLGEFARWLAPIDTAGILATPIPWYVDRNKLHEAANLIGIKAEQLYTVLLCMEY